MTDAKKKPLAEVMAVASVHTDDQKTVSAEAIQSLSERIKGLEDAFATYATVGPHVPATSQSFTDAYVEVARDHAKPLYDAFEQWPDALRACERRMRDLANKFDALSHLCYAEKKKT
jgi:hypothetical protein